MDIVMIVLRVLHVLGGVFWAGTTFALAAHITPSVKATGPEGQKFMQHLTGKSGLSNWLAITGTLTVLSGLIMYTLQGWDKALNTPSGVALGIGVLLGTAAYLHGLFVQRKTTARLQAVGQAMIARGNELSADDRAQLATLSARLSRNGAILAYLLALTVVLMGTFQYF